MKKAKRKKQQDTVDFPLNLGKRLHKKLAKLAEERGVGLNAFIVEIIRDELDVSAAKGTLKC